MNELIKTWKINFIFKINNDNQREKERQQFITDLANDEKSHITHSFSKKSSKRKSKKSSKRKSKKRSQNRSKKRSKRKSKRVSAKRLK